MTTERAIEVLSQYFTHRHHPDVIQQALDKAIEVMRESVNDKSENDIREFCRDLIQDNVTDRGILIALKEYAGGNQ